MTHTANWCRPSPSRRNQPWYIAQKSSQSLFSLSQGKPLTVIDTLMAFQQKFLANTNPELSQNTEHILHFLLAATKHDASTITRPPTSQLVIQLEALPFDQVLTHWATSQFARLWQIT